jgi:Cft2 family RNA processing exonuclease
MRRRGPLHHVVLVHGEPSAQDAMKACLVERGFPSIHVPARGDIITV